MFFIGSWSDSFPSIFLYISLRNYYKIALNEFIPLVFFVVVVLGNRRYRVTGRMSQATEKSVCVPPIPSNIKTMLVPRLGQILFLARSYV